MYVSVGELITNAEKKKAVGSIVLNADVCPLTALMLRAPLGTPLGCTSCTYVLYLPAKCWMLASSCTGIERSSFQRGVSEGSTLTGFFCMALTVLLVSPWLLLFSPSSTSLFHLFVGSKGWGEWVEWILSRRRNEWSEDDCYVIELRICWLFFFFFRKFFDDDATLDFRASLHHSFWFAWSEFHILFHFLLHTLTCISCFSLELFPFAFCTFWLFLQNHSCSIHCIIHFAFDCCLCLEIPSVHCFLTSLMLCIQVLLSPLALVW